MALFCGGKLGGRSVLSTIGRIPCILSRAQYAQTAAGVPKITIQKAEPPKEEHYDNKNERLKRPLSPHLSIYAFQMTSTLSITHRATGMALSAYTFGLGIGALVLPNDVSHYIALLENVSPAVLFLAKFCIAAPFGYHFANGIRHLYWDTARGLTLKEVYSTGYAMLGLATLITIAIAAL
ncbi:succinate dehydrogenase cytochrome b560 subunit, mitochondrial-like [Hyposmocoma kahamanoa]|uniref:succinate dehydrogenase cytochrome b560 subunit, mitochondrial-like n=1 Tax=Hyposmocoma kahamanoa TaxID=1477025 RepID=UPI000E6DA1FF|nr:succinate dehydrogenase cytochrome b560 subunit, mitochondrial-like [Hyposmocoma kahamanoa]